MPLQQSPGLEVGQTRIGDRCLPDLRHHDGPAAVLVALVARQCRGETSALNSQRDAALIELDGLRLIGACCTVRLRHAPTVPTRPAPWAG